MTPEKVLEIVLREVTAFGQGWRADWSDFDGRTLRDQINGVNDWAKRALQDKDDSDYTEGTDFSKRQNTW